MPDKISIKVSLDTHYQLTARMSARETYDQVIRRLLEATAKRRRTRKAREEGSPDGKQS